jgi:hypothetical protein
MANHNEMTVLLVSRDLRDLAVCSHQRPSHRACVYGGSFGVALALACENWSSSSSSRGVEC